MKPLPVTEISNPDTPAHVELTQRLARSAETKWNEESALVENARNDGRACLLLTSPLSSRVVVRARRVAGHNWSPWPSLNPLMQSLLLPASFSPSQCSQLHGPVGERRDEQLLSAAGLT